MTINYNLEGNYLIGQKFAVSNFCSDEGTIRLTARYLKIRPNPESLFSSINPIQRYSDFSPYPGLNTRSSNENRNIFQPNTNCSFTYSSHGFAELGGYQFFFSQKNSLYFKQINTLLTESLFLNETTNNLVFEFVLYNGDLNYFTYTAVVFQTKSGGEIFQTYYIWPMKLKLYITSGDIARGLFEVVTVLLLGYQIYVTFTSLKNKFKCYDD